VVRVAALGFFVLAACATESSDERSQIGAPCTRPKDCVTGAVCTSGVCVDADAGESQDDAGDGGDGGG